MIKFVKLFSCILAPFVFYSAVFGGINTAGTDYALYIVSPNEQREAAWLGNNHDIIIAPNDITAGDADSTGRQITVETYDTIMSANSNAIIITYVPYNTVTQTEKNWMENWATTHGHDVEDLYYHYYIDTTIRDRSGVYHTIPGYGGGSAATLEESRVQSLWLSAAYPNVAPSLPVFREAYNEFLLNKVVLVGAESDQAKRVKGVLLDTFEGTINSNNLSVYLENTREIRQAVTGDISTAITYTQARDYVTPYMISHVKEMTAVLETESGINTAWVFPNIAELNGGYYWFPDLWEDVIDSEYNKKYDEYFGKSSNIKYTDIDYLKYTYNDLVNGAYIIGQCQGTDTGGDNTQWFKGLVARLFLVQHPNFYGAFHDGSAVYYGPSPQDSSGTYANSTWQQVMGYDLGAPSMRPDVDYWGATGTDRFYLIKEDTNNWKAVARKFTGGLVIQVFGDSTGIDVIGTEVKTIDLGGTYQELSLNGTPSGSDITTIDLGLGEGAILINTLQSTHKTISFGSGTKSIQFGSGTKTMTIQ